MITIIIKFYKLVKKVICYAIPRSIIEISLVVLIGLIIIYLDSSKVLFPEIILTLTTFVVGASRLMPGIEIISFHISLLSFITLMQQIFLVMTFFKFLRKKRI